MKLRFIGGKKSRQIAEGKTVVYELTCTLDLEKYFLENFGVKDVPARIRKKIQNKYPMYKFSCDKGCIFDENGKKVDGFKITSTAKVNEGETYDTLTGRIISEGRAKEKAYTTASGVANIVCGMLCESTNDFNKIAIETNLLRKTEHKRLRKFFSKMGKKNLTQLN